MLRCKTALRFPVKPIFFLFLVLAGILLLWRFAGYYKTIQTIEKLETETNWLFVGIEEQGKPFFEIIQDEPYWQPGVKLLRRQDGIAFSATLGCNRLSGRIPPPAFLRSNSGSTCRSTLRGCSKKLGELEKTVSSVLCRASTMELEKGLLRIRGGHNTTLVLSLAGKSP